jgi:Leucine-rich repeat (LRR) protein
MNGVENLIRLKSLNICHNNLISLSGIENLINLKYLFAACNKITSIREIRKLHYLIECSVDNNCIKSIMPITHLNNLKHLIYDKNPVCHTDKLNFRKYLHPDQINIFNYWQYHFKCSILLKNLVCGHFIKNICDDMLNKHTERLQIATFQLDRDCMDRLVWFLYGGSSCFTYS